MVVVKTSVIAIPLPPSASAVGSASGTADCWISSASGTADC